MAKNKDRHTPKSPVFQTLMMTGNIGFRCTVCDKVFGPATVGKHKH